jgi:tetratricopeptide (TPR) repeat protein
MATANGGVKQRERLKSWKEIATFFGTDERTVRRWEERGLPVRRVPGGARPTVYANVSELESWLKSRATAASDDTVKRDRGSWRYAIAGAVLLALLTAAGGGILWSERERGPGSAATVRHQPPRRAVDLYLAGTYHWERRTPESLKRAVDLYGQAIAEDPAYAEAYVGLANAYLLLREFSTTPEAEAYPRAEAAAERAVALDPTLADAHAALAFVDFWWKRDFDGGLLRFRQAIALNPNNASAHHWYATALDFMNQVRPALEQIDLAQQLDPQSRSILADKALVLFHAGRGAEAASMLAQMEETEPEFLSPHTYLSAIHFAGRNFPAFLAEARTAARLSGDRARLAMLEQTAKAYRRGGDHAMLSALLEGRRRLHAEGHESVYALAQTAAQLGDRGLAMRYLEQSVRLMELSAAGMRGDPVFRDFRQDPAFQRLVAQAIAARTQNG